MHFESKFPIVLTSNFSFIIQRLAIYAMIYYHYEYDRSYYKLL